MRKFAVVLLCFWISWPATAAPPCILVMGDSLSAGHGIDIDRGWVRLLQQRLERQDYNYRVVNASISGETTSGARTRVDQLIKTEAPAITVVELGGNDGLRGIQLSEMRNNLDYIIRSLRNAGSKVLLLPMKLPPNYGPAYTRRFEEVYRQLASADGVVLGGFILEGIALNPKLMQADGIHPRAEAEPMMLDTVWASLKPMLRSPADAGK